MQSIEASFVLMNNISEKWRAFCEWQQRPSLIPKMTEGHHRCHTCGLEFQGNYCPCCGQSARIGRYSFKNALLLFLDVWGVGNRGMFRSIRDLMLRPGYMIRDYLSGMQMAYFPPFKMFFLLCTLSILVDTGLNIQGINRAEKYENEYSEILESWFTPLDYAIETHKVQEKESRGKVEEKPTEETKERNEAKAETKKNDLPDALLRAALAVVPSRTCYARPPLLRVFRGDGLYHQHATYLQHPAFALVLQSED